MNTLDCESLLSATASVCQLLGLSTAELENRLRNVSEADFEIHTDITLDRWGPMLSQVAGQQIEEQQEGETCWFHASRVAAPESFLGGLRPLGDQLDWTWEFLGQLVSKDIAPQRWKTFRLEVEKDHYGHPQDVFDAWFSDQGPSAFLFADKHLNWSDHGSHDYFRVSELVDFIVDCCDRVLDIPLRAMFREATKPVLVKFVTPGIRAGHLGATLDYLMTRKALDSFALCSPSFSGDGREIPPEKIVKIIPVEEHTRRREHNHPYSLSPPERQLLANRANHPIRSACGSCQPGPA